MNKQEIIKKYDTEVGIQKERLKNIKTQIEALCENLGLDANTVTKEEVEESLKKEEVLLKDFEETLQILIKDYEEIGKEVLKPVEVTPESDNGEEFD